MILREKKKKNTAQVSLPTSVCMWEWGVGGCICVREDREGQRQRGTRRKGEGFE